MSENISGNINHIPKLRIIKGVPIGVDISSCIGNIGELKLPEVREVKVQSYTPDVYYENIKHKIQEVKSADGIISASDHYSYISGLPPDSKVPEILVDLKVSVTGDIKIEIDLEDWKLAPPEYGGIRASTFGRIKYPTGNLCKAGISKNKGYKILGAINGDPNKKEYIHRIIALTFLLNLENKPNVNHINGIKHDNRLKNLEFVTQEENSNRQVFPNAGGGDVKVIQYTLEMVEIKIWESIGDVSRELKIDRSTISAVCKGKRQTAGNYKWRYYIENIDGEIWKDIMVGGTKIKVSNHGRYYTMKGHMSYGGKCLKYLTINLNGNHHPIHRLICFAFNPLEGYINYEDYDELDVNHKDNNGTNNHYTNLEWCTTSQNMLHAREFTIDHASKSKSVQQLDDNGNVLKTFVSIKEASKYTSIDHRSISLACKETWRRAGKFKWIFTPKNN